MEVSKKNELTLEEYFKTIRKNIVGHGYEFDTPQGRKKLLYADWTASGRLYKPIEEKLLHEIGPLVGNTHTETNVTGTSMTLAYHEAKKIIKKHVNASDEDVIILAGSGMTGVVNKFQRILGMKIPEKLSDYVDLPEEMRPVIFVTHMEHHSNQTSWLETIADVVVVPPDVDGLVDLNNFEREIRKYSNRKIKIAAVTSCSNVTGIMTPYHEIAKLMHKNNGLCFVDFAASAPYIPINMHPTDLGHGADLDAVYFSPHKFLGGPGTPGALIFNTKLYTNKIPDQPGGGTVNWTNPWNIRSYIEDIEVREDGGTPPFLQSMKAAMTVRLKEEMDPGLMLKREHEILKKLYPALQSINELQILAEHIEDRLGIISFHITDLHYNLGVKLLNDYFGIQVRGGCACAGTYGHYLLHIDPKTSQKIFAQVKRGIMDHKPGWIRLSIHPAMSDDDIDFIIHAMQELVNNFKKWSDDYEYNHHTNEYTYKGDRIKYSVPVTNWFKEI